MPFSDGLALVRQGEQWGFIDTAGMVVIPIEFPAQRLQYLGEGLFLFERDGLAGLVAITGR